MHSRFSVVVAFLLVALVLSHAFGKDEKRGKRLVATDGQRRNLDSKSKGKKGTPEDDGVSNDANDDPFMCQDFPETWDESLLVAEAKQWPDAAKSQPPLDLSGEYLPAGVTLPPGIKCAQRIWQECLEITITGGCINEAVRCAESVYRCVFRLTPNIVYTYMYTHSPSFRQENKSAVALFTTTLWTTPMSILTWLEISCALES